MATAQPTNRPPSGSKSISSFDSPVHSIIEPSRGTMSLPRPKSAKGRSRPTSSYAQKTEACLYSNPVSPPFCELSSSPPAPPLLPASYPPVRTSRATKEEVPELFHQVPSRPSSSLNRYRVLPSIGRREPRHPEVKSILQQTSKLNLHPDREETISLYREKKQPLCKSNAATSKTQLSQCEAPSLPDEPLGSEPKLHLAVKSPTGQRFERCFRPSDTLQTVLSVAECRNNTKYRKCIVETMDIPRRSFLDLSKTLEECGIQNKSVLCILQEDGD
ncbi:UBX domain-containing protein 10 [Callorhinchus milii]|uniref:UBX domain protein 10 n=1 Tax=Callorhinchus milii TaxID=7868 RepID=V9L695_CALMI|nr:UBX domain-containing protein 10 [Callorhinchus milii]XP_007900259.1 UBX domain-containing protein 10 [Callorhinchus milii]|eukprot:gi/632967934/ref/XP_007900258.1/ PREDICTED: UBX domain-containing protein 10 [Callorhinchus milii]